MGLRIVKDPTLSSMLSLKNNQQGLWKSMMIYNIALRIEIMRDSLGGWNNKIKNIMRNFNLKESGPLRSP